MGKGEGAGGGVYRDGALCDHRASRRAGGAAEGARSAEGSVVFSFQPAAGAAPACRLSAYSTDLLSDIGYEIQDVDPHAEGILYEFIGSPSIVSHDAIILTLKNALQNKESTSEESADRIFDLLLWYGFLGIKIDSIEIRYIYNFNYNMQLFRGFIKKQGDKVSFVINPAFWSALVIEES